MTPLFTGLADGWCFLLSIPISQILHIAQRAVVDISCNGGPASITGKAENENPFPKQLRDYGRRIRKDWSCSIGGYGGFFVIVAWKDGSGYLGFADLVGWASTIVSR